MKARTLLVFVAISLALLAISLYLLFVALKERNKAVQLREVATLQTRPAANVERATLKFQIEVVGEFDPETFEKRRSLINSAILSEYDASQKNRVTKELHNYFLEAEAIWASLQSQLDTYTENPDNKELKQSISASLDEMSTLLFQARNADQRLRGQAKQRITETETTLKQAVVFATVCVFLFSGLSGYALTKYHLRTQHLEQSEKMFAEHLKLYHLASQELQKPISELRQYLEFGQANLWGEEVTQSDILAQSLKKVAYLDNLVSNAIFLNKLEGNAESFHKEPIFLSSTVKIEDEYQHLVRVVVTQDMEVLADKRRVQDAVAGFITHAISMNSETVVKINKGIEIFPDGDDSHLDTMRRVQNEVYRGLGVNLFISQRIIELHGWTLSTMYIGESSIGFTIEVG